MIEDSGELCTMEDTLSAAKDQPNYSKRSSWPSKASEYVCNPVFTTVPWNWMPLHHPLEFGTNIHARSSRAS